MIVALYSPTSNEVVLISTVRFVWFFGGTVPLVGVTESQSVASSPLTITSSIYKPAYVIDPSDVSLNLILTLEFPA